MQNTLPLTPGNPLRNITGLARQIALPGEHVPLRYPSFPALERTAVMGFNQPATLSLLTGVATAMTVFRQATFPVWADQLAAYLGVVDYVGEAIIGGLGPMPVGGQVYLKMRTALANWTSKARVAALYSLGVTITGSQSLLPYPLFGKDGPGYEYTYLPAGCTVMAVLSTGATASTSIAAKVQLEAWASPGETFSSGIFDMSLTGLAVTGASGSVGPFTSNYWVRVSSVYLREVNVVIDVPSVWALSLVVSNQGLAYASSAVTAGTVTVGGIKADVMHLPLVLPVEFTNSTLPWYATRVTAAALLGTNVTQILNKGGTVLGGRVSPAVQDPFNVLETYINGLHPAEKAFLPLETGVYTYCPPSTDLVFFTDYSLNTAGGAPSAPLFILENDAMYNKMFLRTAGIVESLACTCSWHIEFRTSSSLFQVGLCAMTLESLHQAQLVLAESGFFFENPEHDKVLSKVISAAKKFAPAMVTAVNPVAGRALGALMAASRGHKAPMAIIPKSGPSKPKATNALSSGMMSVPRKGKKKTNKKK